MVQLNIELPPAKDHPDFDRWLLQATQYLRDYLGLYDSGTQISFTQVGTGTETRTIQEKAQDIYHVKDFGATGDGLTDDTTDIQAAITAAAGNILEFGGSDNTYVITAPLTLPSETHLRGSGVIIDASGLAGTLHAITSIGTLGDAEAITSGADIFSYAIAVADDSDFAAEDFVLVASGDHYSYTGQDTDFGEVVQIRGIDAGDISFATPLNHTFSTSPVLYPVTWKENIVIEGLDVRGSNTAAAGERGICLRYVKNFSVRNCKISGIDHYGIEINASIHGEVRNNFIKGVFYDGVTGTIFYGIIVINSSQYVNVVNNIGHKNRHLVVTTANTGGNGYFGQPQFVNVEGNIFHDSEAGDSGRSFAFENHGFGRFINWQNNIANGCYAGVRIENGTNNTVSGNIIRNYAYAGIMIGGSGNGATNLKIENNDISGMTNELAGEAAILVQAVSGTFNNLQIVNNTIRDPYNSTAFENAIKLNANTSYKSCLVAGNLIFSSVDNTAYAISCEDDADHIDVIGNDIYGFRAGIKIAGDRCTVKNNVIRNIEAKGSGFGIYSNGLKSVIQGNTMININTIARLDSSSNTNIFANNQAIDCTTGAVSDAGTTNTKRDNDAI